MTSVLNTDLEAGANVAPRILVAGVGNIFLGDDAFGVEVVQRLACRALPAGVRVVDFGIRGLDLTYALLEGWDVAILVDAAPRGQAPGSLYVIEPDPVVCTEPADLTSASPLIETHGMDPVKVLRLVAAMGGQLRQVLVVGCEPAPAPADEMQMCLSAEVAAAIDPAVALVELLISRIPGIAEPPLVSPDTELPASQTLPASA